MKLNMIKLLFILVMLPSLAIAQATLTGTLKNSDGSNFNGKLTLRISQPVAVSSSGSCGGPVLIVPGKAATYSIVNGAVPGGAQIYGNDCMFPTNACYIVDQYDAQNNQLAEYRWTITGSTVDVGTLVPNGPNCGQVPTGNTLNGDYTVTGNLNVLGSLNFGTQTFTNTTVQNITVQGLITGSLASIAPTGTGLKSNGSQYVATDTAAPGSGTCPASQWVSSLLPDTDPLCSQPGFVDLAGIASKAQLPPTAVYTDQANSLQDGTGSAIVNSSDATKKVQLDVSGVTASSTTTEAVPDVSPVVGSRNVTRLYKETQRSMQTVFFPGVLTSTWTALTFVPDIAITVTRADLSFKTAPAGCSTQASIRMTDGTNNFDVSANNTAHNSAAGSTIFAAGSTVTLSVRIAASGCSTAPADAIVNYQYRMN